MIQRFRELDRSAAVFRTTAALCFLVFFLFNCMTPYIGDDYVYMFSFETGEQLHRVADIIPSMMRHAYTMNGRLVSHALEQFFLLMPKLVFNLCSSAIFLWLMLAAYSVCNIDRERSTLLFLVIVMSFWNYVPVFGQVCLWQVGTINYLWAVAFCMFFLRPYFALFFGESARPGVRMPRHPAEKLLFVVLAFFFGAYSEISSMIGVVLAVGILLFTPAERRRAGLWLIAPILVALAGYFVMIRQPAEHAKQGALALADILKAVPDVTAQMQKYLTVPFIAWAVLMTLAVAGGAVSPARRTASVGFFLASVAGSYITVFAAAFPERCMISSAFFILLACCILLPELLESSAGLACKAALSVLALVFAVNLIYGVGDIGSSWYQQRARNAQIAEAIANGDREITLSRIYYATEYSPFFEMRDLDRYHPDSWPNCYMAIIYGFDRVYGTSPVTAEEYAARQESQQES